MNLSRLFFLIFVYTCVFTSKTMGSEAIFSPTKSASPVGINPYGAAYLKFSRTSFSVLANEDEEEIGTYTLVPGSVLVIKKTNNTFWLLQTDKQRSYYVIRGRNFVYDPNVQIDKLFNSARLANEVTKSGGLKASKTGDLPAKWEIAWWEENGYTKNAEGVYSKIIIVIDPVDPDTIVVDTTVIEVVPDTTVLDTVIVEPPFIEKIKIPVGMIMWDVYYRDYWNDENPKYDPLINYVSETRLVASEWRDQFNVVPFYGQYHDPEKIKIRYNVRWDQASGQNIYDEVEKEVTVKYDKSQDDADREIQYYDEAGIDFLCFNYYNDNSPLSEARLMFVASEHKRNMKMTFMVAPNRSETEINYITDLMLKDYWFKIDNKPVLYFTIDDIGDLEKYRSYMRAKGGGDIYVVYFSIGGYPGDFADYQKYNANAASSYTLSMGSGDADMMIKAEVKARNIFMNQFKDSFVNLIPVLSTGFENLYQRSSIIQKDGQVIPKATLPQLEEKLELMKTFINEHPNKVPAILWYAANEVLESGNPIVPTKSPDGKIDTSVLDTIGKHLE
ncbi:hypothetical protein EGI22_02200 [Lacihabitans sp. LS3-19]|uniref:hypothetical protein n=1 Tax=Lacihabitans sp. LS3-19 TaxID=2487335 RepID=UPI0020CE6250|nr:hypothetical protein [Lacihabitans sp. LS3-19]MCP9766703.1 hypothetical protein [Lacihabitans sp. LS3-19]